MFSTYLTIEPSWFFSKANDSKIDSNSKETNNETNPISELGRYMYLCYPSQHSFFIKIFFTKLRKRNKNKDPKREILSFRGFGCQQKLTIIREWDHKIIQISDRLLNFYSWPPSLPFTSSNLVHQKSRRDHNKQLSTTVSFDCHSLMFWNFKVYAVCVAAESVLSVTLEYFFEWLSLLVLFASDY